MALDALFLSHLVSELQETLQDAKIDKVQQPERDELVLQLRSARGNFSLLLSANGNPRLHLTERKLENPAQPPMFCMLLRKRIQGGIIRSVTQPGLERAVDIGIEVRDELGELTGCTLTLELIGRCTNLILRDGDNRIVDCLRRVDLSQSGRGVLPGLFYQLPPTQEKRDPRTIRRAELYELLATGGDLPCDRFLLDTFFGLSPLLAREITARATGNCATRLDELTDTLRERVAAETVDVIATQGKPYLYRKEGMPKEFSFLPLTQYAGLYEEEQCVSFSTLLDAFYGERSAKERIDRKSATLRKTVETAVSRIRRKLVLQEKELAAAEDRERYRHEADLITANLYQIPQGTSQVTVIDYFDENTPEVQLKLDRRMSPQDNAAALYKKYHRLKNAVDAVTEQMELGRAELAYLESVLENLNEAENEQDLSEIREELEESGYLRAQKNRRRGKSRTFQPRVFQSSDGFRIYVGRNNRQNDFLTFMKAHRMDGWCHAKGVPGAHVIVEQGGRAVPDRTLTEVLMLAAYYSKARYSANVAVDYTAVTNVKKPSGAKPGMVNYFHYNTAFVTPDPALIEKLRVE